jgi:hypothetical protein
MKKPLPRWIDEAGVEQFVLGILDERAMEADRQHHMRLAEHDIPGPPLSIFEDEAMDQAQRRGNFELLATLLGNGFPLSRKAVGLITDKLSGKFTLPSKRPKETPEERLLKYPVYLAAEDVGPIEWALGEYFPDQEPGQIKDRAIAIAARVTGVPVETLASHMKRGKKRRL